MEETAGIKITYRSMCPIQLGGVSVIVCRHAGFGRILCSVVLLVLTSCDFSFENRQTFDLSKFDPSGTILDIGGGGAGVIGRLADNPVIAVEHQS